MTTTKTAMQYKLISDISVHNCRIRHSTEPLIFPLNLQTTTTAQMMFTGGDVAYFLQIRKRNAS